jgi:cobalt/nickel transport system permease protein
MHMADALLSPAVGGAMWIVSGGMLAVSARRLRRKQRRLAEGGVEGNGGVNAALMGVMGAFVFAAQMINFSIPATGSSGHLAGGLLLGILLGPEAAFLVIASVLVIQALFFADGGLLALGCNMFNMGFVGCWVGYPLIYRPIVGARPTRRRIFLGSLLAAVVSLQLGAGAVVIQTKLSGISALPWGTFAMLMMPIHLAIGVVEGLTTAAIVTFIGQARPELLAPPEARPSGFKVGRVAIGLAVVAAFVAGVLSWFASKHPDGLEWAIKGMTGDTELAEPTDRIHPALARLQKAVAILPDYAFPSVAPAKTTAKTTTAKAGEAPENATPRVVQAGTTTAGLLGATLTLGASGAIGLALRRRRIVH